MGAGVRGSVSLKDNATAVLRQVRKEQSAFKKEVESTKKAIKNAYDKKIEAKMETSSAVKHIKQLSKKLEPLRKKISTAVAVKDMAKAKIASIKSKLKSLHNSKAEPTAKIKDKTGSGISKIAGALKKLAAGVVIVATIATAAGSAVKSGMELEQQQISIEHFVGATNKDYSAKKVKEVSKGFIKQLRDNANATPFETGDVISSGSRAIAIASGNTTEAMSLVALAEDMAASSGGTKSISDAIEALADAKLGEMERLKEFGFKVSKKEFDSKGFKGVSNDLSEFFGGAAQKQAQSGNGLISTIKGKLKSSVADFGIKVVEKLKPVLSSVIGLIEKAQPLFESVSDKLASGFGGAIEFFKAKAPEIKKIITSLTPIFESISGVVADAKSVFMSTFAELSGGFGDVAGKIGEQAPSIIEFIEGFKPVIKDLIGMIPLLKPGIQAIAGIIPQVMPVITTVMTTVSSIITKAAPLISGVCSGISTVIGELAPVFTRIFGSIGEKVGSVIEFIGSKMGFIQEVIAWAAPFISDILSTAWSVISPIMDLCISVFKTLFNAVQKYFPKIKGIINSVWEFVKPIVERIGGAISTISEKLGKWGDKLFGGGDVGANAAGTNSWRGGVTWVGEKGPELVDLPRNTRILPHKESVAFAGGGTGGRHVVNISLAKIADSIVVREEADIDKIGEAVAKKVKEVTDNVA